MPSAVVSNSQVRTYKRCKRKYWLTYVRKLKPRRYGLTGARQLGTRVHGALEAYYQPGSAGRDAAFAYLDSLRFQELEKAQDAYEAEEVEKEHGLAVTMMEGYIEWLQEEGADADLEIVAAEQAVRTASPVEGIELIGKLDAIARKRSTGDEGFVDHKTVADLQTPLKTFGIEEQPRMYALMQRIADPEHQTRFQLWNMLKKSKRTARAKPPFFSRYEIYINDSELRAMWDRIHGELIELQRFEHAIEGAPEQHRSIAYPTPQSTCSWDCDFISVCPLFDDDHSDPEYLLAANFVEGDPHAHYDGQLAAVISEPESARAEVGT